MIYCYMILISTSTYEYMTGYLGFALTKFKVKAQFSNWFGLVAFTV
jgi:hypothetical protein